MLKAGLTGGLACGKTFAGAELQRLGCHIVHADELGHQVLAPGGEAYEPAIALLGRGILDPDGNIDRQRTAEIVFRDPAKLAALNALVHPAVRRRKEQIFADVAAADPDAIAVMEAAILVESGIYKDYDKLIVVVCSPGLQLDRALTRDPLMSRESVLARLARQMPVEEKRKYADFVIDTSGTKEETIRQTREIYSALREWQAAQKKLQK